MPLGGGIPTTLASNQSYPFNIVVQAGSLYWTNSGNANQGALFKLPVNGGMPLLLASQQAHPAGIVIDAQRLYWTSVAGGSIRTLPLNGTQVTTIASGQGDPVALAVVGSAVYWTTDGTGNVVKAELGRAPVVLASGIAPAGIVADERRVYWTDAMGTVQWVPTAGGEPQVVATAQFGAWAMATDASNIYWINDDAHGAVMKLAK